MTRRSFTSRPTATVIVAFLLLSQSACGFFLTRGAPRNHEKLSYFSCSEVPAGPMLDALMGVGFVALLASAGAWSRFTPAHFWALVYGASATRGFQKSNQCRRAKAQLAERLVRRGEISEPVSAVVATIVVHPQIDTLAPGERLQLLAIAHDSAGTEITGRAFRWSSADTLVASVGRAGLVTAHGAGRASIAAMTDTLSGAAIIIVVASRE